MTSPSDAPDEGAGRSGTLGGPTAVLRGRPGFREPPEDYVRAASQAPGHWMSVVDRHWNGDEDEPPPSWARLGRWRSDGYGEIVEWEENPGYRPSPDAHGWPPPVSPVDAAVQLVATGYASQELFALMLADAELAVCVDGNGGLTVTEAQDGTEAVPVFSAAPEPHGGGTARARGDVRARTPGPAAARKGSAVPQLVRPGGAARHGGRTARGQGRTGGVRGAGAPRHMVSLRCCAGTVDH